LGRLFGTDGVRGIANEKLNAELAMRLGCAAAAVLSGNSRRRPVFVVGMDSRISSDMLAMACAAGLCSVGADVIMLGVVPTPAVAYLVGKYKADAGIMISASHNPAEFNGIKMFGGEGLKLPDEIEERIENYALGEIAQPEPAKPESIGKVIYMGDQVVKDYVDHLTSTVSYSLDGLKIAVDCANGSASRTAERLFKSLGAECRMLYNCPDGFNINRGCGSTDMANLVRYVKEHGMDAGVAFDGDADRIVMADEEGRLIDGNGLLAILACDMLKSGRLPQNCLATTIMANGGLLKAIEPLGGKIIWTKVGDRYVVEAMREHDLALGGEASGHMVLLEYNTTGDALIAALQVLATMVRHDTPLSVLASVYHHMPEAHANVPHDDGAVPSEEELAGLVREAEAGLKGRGRVVIRPSGTEPIIRVMVQHEVRREAEALVEALAKRVAAL